MDVAPVRDGGHNEHACVRDGTRVSLLFPCLIAKTHTPVVRLVPARLLSCHPAVRHAQWFGGVKVEVKVLFEQY